MISTQVKIGHCWYISKPLKYPFIRRIKDAWKVFTGKYVAVMFAEDMVKDKKLKSEISLLSVEDVDNIKKVAMKAMERKVFPKNINGVGDLKFAPNELCPCGSGKKWKKCHGKD
jgi:hypothetical protein